MIENGHHPFEFRTRLTVTKLTRRVASDLAALAHHLREVPPSVVFQHTHHFLVQHQELSPEPPNDFAYWVTNVLQEDALGERLAAVDTIRFANLDELRKHLVALIEAQLESTTQLRTAPPGEEFHFKDGVSVVLPTGHVARTLPEFREALGTVGARSIAYHLFEARLRLGADDNDFSRWLEREVGLTQVAQALRTLDPYTYTLEGLRKVLLGALPVR
jgi:hypothetical protein